MPDFLLLSANGDKLVLDSPSRLCGVRIRRLLIPV